MRKLLIGAAAASALFTAAPVMAQGVGVYGPGVDIRVGRDHRDHDGYRSYGWDRDRDYRYGTHRSGCKSVTVRERQWDGSTVTRTRERC